MLAQITNAILILNIQKALWINYIHRASFYSIPVNIT